MTHAHETHLDSDDDYVARVFSPADGWAIVAHALVRLAAAFGAHDALARNRSLAGETVRALLTQWLRPLELFARKLLFVMACGLEEVATEKSATRIAPPPHDDLAPAPRACRTDDPQSWRVCFRVQPTMHRLRAHGSVRSWRPRGEIERDIGYWLVDRYIEREAREARRAAAGPGVLRADQFMRRADYDEEARDAQRHAHRPLQSHDGFPLARRIEALRRLLADPTPHALTLARRLKGLAPEAGSERVAAFAAPHDRAKGGPCRAGLALVDRLIRHALRPMADTS